MGAAGFVAFGAATVVCSLSALAFERMPSNRWQLPLVSRHETLADRATVGAGVARQSVLEGWPRVASCDKFVTYGSGPQLS